MIVAAHQPSFLPWLGYLDKIARADLFVVMDDLQYEAQNFQNRNRAKLNHGPAWLTVPVERGAQTDLVIDKRIRDDGDGRGGWRATIWTTLKVHYGRAPYFARYAPELEATFARRWSHLVDLDLHILALATRWLGIATPIVRSSTLGLVGHKTDRIVDMCRKVGADAYLSGRGGSVDYLDHAAFAAAGVELVWQRFVHPTYPQRYPELGFVPNLGFLDLLLNCGPQSGDLFRTTPRSASLAGSDAHP